MAKNLLVLVIDGNQSVRDGLAARLAEHPGLGIAVAESATAALAQLRETTPDVILVDASLGNEDGSHQLVRDLRQEAPGTAVIVMDLLPVQEGMTAFSHAGANGFIVKDATIDDFVRTIRSVADRAYVVPRSPTATPRSPIGDETKQAARMTKREREITTLIALGLSNKAIAHRLNIAVYTVKSHVHNILQKLALDTRVQIAAHLGGADSSDTDARTHHP